MLEEWTAIGAATWLGLFAISLAAAWLALWLVARRVPRGGLLIAGDDAPVAFLFDGHTLIDATPQARQLLAAAPREGSDWSRLMMLLLPRFPEIETRIGGLSESERLDFTSLDQAARLRAEWHGEHVRLTLDDTEAPERAAEIDGQGLRAMQAEVETLRMVTDHTPCLVWRQTARGQITWANRVYLDLVRSLKPDVADLAWPPPALFEAPDLLSTVDESGVRRLPLSRPSGQQMWFDVTSHRVGEEVLFVALDVAAVVQAESQLREFMQTLTKTFANLTIGLAIFDRSRHLALFNPALTDLTQLPADFLASRPTLFGFLDRLREKKMIPEPKDYKGWRSKLMELEAAASEGSYHETWSLPTGQTYRVTGRPHPDGAVAFLFENISAEILLTRRFRSELEMGQAVIDSFDEAIAVFSSDGILTMSNRAYETLWGDDPGTSLRDISIADATRTWMERCSPSPVWGDIRDFTGPGQDRVEWSAELRMRDGRGLDCRVTPLAGGATLVGFRVTQGTARIAASEDDESARARG